MRLTLLITAFFTVAIARNPRYEAVEIDNVEIIDIETDDATSCESSTFDKCSKSYLKELGVRIGGGPEDYARRLMALEAVYGRDGFTKICNADQTFRKCVGSSFDQCMTIDALVALGLPRSRAMSYIEIFKKKDYECAHKSLITAKGTWECLGLTALDEGKEEMRRCHEDFVQHVSHTPRDVCKFAQQYDLCIRRTFQSRCGAKVGRDICEVVKIGLTLRLPQCKIACASEEPNHFPHRPHAVGHEFVADRHLVNSFDSDDTINDAECNANRLKQCAKEARDSIGITSSKIEEVIMEAGDIAKTKDGYLKVCGAEKQFVSCAGSTVLPQCLRMETLMKLGLNIVEAAEVNISYFIMDYECNNEVFADNFECLVRTNREKAEELKMCQLHFSQIVSQHPSQEVLCKALQTYAACNQKAYEDSCGAEVGEAICEFSGLMIKQYMPEAQSCSVQCSARQSSLIYRVLADDMVQYALEHYEMEDDENACDATKFRQCTTAFKKELNLHGKGVRPVLAGLKTIVDKEGKQGFQKICGAGAHFAKCGGTAGDCTAIDTLVKQFNISQIDAVILNVTIFSLTYECTHPVFTDNFDCLVQTQKAKKHVIKRCEQRFVKEMKKHPGLLCKAVQQLLDCTVSPFKRACGAPVAEGLCQFEKLYVETYVPHIKGCPLHCNV